MKTTLIDTISNFFLRWNSQMQIIFLRCLWKKNIAIYVPRGNPLERKKPKGSYESRHENQELVIIFLLLETYSLQKILFSLSGTTFMKWNKSWIEYVNLQLLTQSKVRIFWGGYKNNLTLLDKVKEYLKLKV